MSAPAERHDLPSTPPLPEAKPPALPVAAMPGSSDAQARRIEELEAECAQLRQTVEKQQAQLEHHFKCLMRLEYEVFKLQPDPYTEEELKELIKLAESGANTSIDDLIAELERDCEGTSHGQ